MKNIILENKAELVRWINELDDLEVISELLELKNRDKSIPLVREEELSYNDDDNFDERWEKAISSSDMRQKTTAYIKSLPWKK